MATAVVSGQSPLVLVKGLEPSHPERVTVFETVASTISSHKHYLNNMIESKAYHNEGTSHEPEKHDRKTTHHTNPTGPKIRHTATNHIRIRDRQTPRKQYDSRHSPETHGSPQHEENPRPHVRDNPIPSHTQQKRDGIGLTPTGTHMAINVSQTSGR